MKFSSKILAAAVAAVALTSTAQAAINIPNSGNSDVVLYVWDVNPNATVPNQGYALDTGLTFSQIQSFTGTAAFNVGGSTNFTNLFNTAEVTGGTVQFTILAGNDKTANPVAVTGGTSAPAWVPGQTQVGTVDNWMDLAPTYLAPIGSSTTEYGITTLNQGNGNTLGTNLLGQLTTNGNSYGVLSLTGTSLSLYQSVSVPNGGTAKKPTLNPATVTPLGITATLLADGELDLTGAPSAVPLPAAAWLLGSGLLGLLGVGRRRKVAA